MRLNIRCCCQPTKILGTMEVLDPRPGAYPVLLADGSYSKIEIKSFISNQMRLKPSFEPFEPNKEIEFERKVESAIYSDDRPVDFWRQFTTFREGDSLNAGNFKVRDLLKVLLRADPEDVVVLNAGQNDFIPVKGASVLNLHQYPDPVPGELFVAIHFRE